jgi:hypothetical protein
MKPPSEMLEMRPLSARVWKIAIFLACVLHAGLGAQETGKPPSAERQPALAQRIAQWIKELDDDRFAVRLAATRSLIGAGKEAAAAVAEAAEGGSVEVSQRAFVVLRELFLSSDGATAAAAKAALGKLGESKNSSVAEKAREALRARQANLLAKLERAGASPGMSDDKVSSLNLDEVEDLRAVLPLLHELPDLESVSLSNAKMGDEEMTMLKGLPKLSNLNLYRSRVGDEGLKVLKHLPSLRRVPMGETLVTDAGLVHLKDLTHLEYVGVRANQVTDAGLVHLKNLTNLTGLHLGETKVTDAGLEQLKHLTALTQLFLWDTKATDEGIARLQKALPKVQINTASPNKAP